MNPGDAAAAGFGDRDLLYRHTRLRRGWTSCPACGGHVLLAPTAALRREIPDADGSCGTCGVALMGLPDGSARVLRGRRPDPASTGQSRPGILH